MYRTTLLRSTTRPLTRALRQPRQIPSRGFASPADKPRGWRNTAVRWGLAGAALYYFTNSTLFAEEQIPKTVDAPAPFTTSDLPTVDSILEEKRKYRKAEEAKVEKVSTEKKEPSADEKSRSEEAPISEQSSNAQSSETQPTEPLEQPSPSDSPVTNSTEGGDIGALEEEAGQQGAFNPETGEINWDCPCLGGMAHGPCGEEFKTAFSCFVFSEEEPKGMDCIEKFQGMQECFREYPEIYAAELASDDTPEMDEPKETSDDTPLVEASKEKVAETPKEKVEGKSDKKQ